MRFTPDVILMQNLKNLHKVAVMELDSAKRETLIQNYSFPYIISYSFTCKKTSCMYVWNETDCILVGECVPSCPYSSNTEVATEKWCGKYMMAAAECTGASDTSQRLDILQD